MAKRTRIDKEDWPLGLPRSLKEAKRKRKDVLAAFASDVSKSGEAERIRSCGREARCRQRECPVCSYLEEKAMPILAEGGRYDQLGSSTGRDKS